MIWRVIMRMSFNGNEGPRLAQLSSGPLKGSATRQIEKRARFKL
jgi:hypothetical protein